MDKGRVVCAQVGFNEAAGFTRRKRAAHEAQDDHGKYGFNEAAGFTRRKHGTEACPLGWQARWLQ